MIESAKRDLDKAYWFAYYESCKYRNNSREDKMEYAKCEHRSKHRTDGKYCEYTECPIKPK